ncbi:hypothetical protein DUNSADRAFT_2807 [Dunaliella salina]|uniref:Uncharacterized protein n=1 Tax=Dunaliella salina TaxID=3046 RepID=A0ABQ7GV29_DUNSA|nr:hypothetical protein DUNSADRAFT_2807 [Dunaliella salina]|eukprot:KAF5838478.1 hypothetical protein DUNSADRAFT_2807 [Dunaliella salina]
MCRESSKTFVILYCNADPPPPVNSKLGSGVFCSGRDFTEHGAPAPLPKVNIPLLCPLCVNLSKQDHQAAAAPPARLLPNAEPTALPTSSLSQRMQQESSGSAVGFVSMQQGSSGSAVEGGSWVAEVTNSPRVDQSGAGVCPAQLSDLLTRKLLCEPCRENLHQANLIVKPLEAEKLQAQICKQHQEHANKGDGRPHPLLSQSGSWIIGRSMSLAAMVVQIMPLLFVHPLLFTLRRAAFLAGFTQLWPRYSQEPQAISLPLLPLIISWLLMWAMSSVALPIGGVAMKWLLVWRFKPGRQVWPLWSCYFLRSWLVQQLLFICGRGAWAAHPALLRFYYQLLGARIGSSVVIDPRAKLFNHDLIAIGDDCCVDGNVRLQPAAYEFGHMTLQPITIGSGCCLATGCCIAPGTNLSPGCCLPPMTSSHDVPYPHNDPWRHKGVISGWGTMKGPVQGDAWGHQFRPFCRSTFPAPGLLFRLILGWPMLLIVNVALPNMPALAFIFLMLSSVKLRADSQLELW